jgi:NAD(P)-dependent dehydrogenase (short-subunit alcohol dehydrogenase family)
MTDLNGKVVLITGGGGGLGEALSLTLAQAGAIPLVADMREEAARKVAQAVQAEGGQAQAILLDIRDERQIEQTLSQVVKDFGKLDILINNAGIDLTVPVEEMSVEDFDRILAVNLRAPFILSKYAFALMKPRRSGHIVNITSTAAKRAWANATAYHASKWGLLGLSHALHVEGRPHNIKVTAIVNGGMQTPFILERFPETPLEVLQDPKNVAETIRFVLTQPAETVIPEVTVLPLRETSWP